MKKRNALPRLLGGLLFLSATTHNQIAWPMQTEQTLAAPPSENGENNSKILVEIFLSQVHKGDIDAIKKGFETVSITKVRPQLFTLGNPPENIAIGRNVPAPVARLAIRLASTYNRGVQLLLAEERLAPDYIAIGTSIFDESFQIPISPDDLKRLSDPALTTPQFHALYRSLTGTGRRPRVE